MTAFMRLVTLIWMLVSLPSVRIYAGPASPGGAMQTGHPVRLAIIVEEPSATIAGDLLTERLSTPEWGQLLERAEIDRVYREQGLSATNAGYLKLGQVLGADGLLLLSALSEGTNQFLQARLVAVGPGVVIGSLRSR